MSDIVINNAWRFKKYYWTITQKGETKFYRAPSEGLKMEHDPISGQLIPTNAIQEYKQKTSKEMMKKLRTFRTKFRDHSNVYWDLVPKLTQDDIHGHWPKQKFPDDLVTLDVAPVELMKFIKKQSWTRGNYDSAIQKYTHKILTKDQVRIELWLKRFSTQIYNKFSDLHPLEKVPLGTPCPDHRHDKRKQ